jgi:hypothetical protein
MRFNNSLGRSNLGSKTWCSTLGSLVFRVMLVPIRLRPPRMDLDESPGDEGSAGGAEPAVQPDLERPATLIHTHAGESVQPGRI